MDPVETASLHGWTPVWVRTSGAEASVDWAIVDGPFSDAFFEQTADRAMQHPFNQVFARCTPLSALETLRAQAPGIPPAGFVFHMSRCGSTLIAQMLSQLSATIVVSEAQPLDALLRLRQRGIDEETLVGWLRAMVSALGRPRFGERRLFVKFHAWHVLELPLIARAFPAVPWVFVFREPRAVLGSHARIAAAETDPAVTSPAYLGLDVAEAVRIGPDAYLARVIAAFCNAALAHSGRGRSAFVEYDELPDVVVSGLLDFFGVVPGADEVGRMRAAALRDAKGKGLFRARAGANGAPQPLDALAADLLDEPYAALVARRSARRFTGRSGRSSP